MTQRVLGLVRELGCVRSPALVKNGILKPRETHSKKRCADTVQGPLPHSSLTSEEEGGGDQKREAEAQRVSSPQRDLI